MSKRISEANPDGAKDAESNAYVGASTKAHRKRASGSARVSPPRGGGLRDPSDACQRGRLAVVASEAATAGVRPRRALLFYVVVSAVTVPMCEREGTATRGA